jgi:hypothetical protein
LISKEMNENVKIKDKVFPIANFLNNIKNFCLEANEFYKSTTIRNMKEKQLDLVQKTIWEITPETRNGVAECLDQSKINFSYSFTTAKFNEEFFERYCDMLNDIQHYVPSTYLSLYFKQLLEQQNAIYFLLENEYLLDNVSIKILILNKLFSILSIFYLIVRKPSLSIISIFIYFNSKFNTLYWRIAH